MIQRLKIIIISSYLDTISAFRIKEALFFGFIFPIMLFILFGYIWGHNDPDYVPFILSGIIGMTILSDTFYGIGPIISQYKKTNILKFLKNLPISTTYHFLGLFISKIIMMIIVILVLFICTIIFFNYIPSAYNALLYFIGVIVGTILFGFFGLILSSFTKDVIGRGLINFIYFIMLFISGAFYSIDAFSTLKSISNIFPLTHLLLFMRGEVNYLFILIGWIILFFLIFTLIIKRMAIKR